MITEDILNAISNDFSSTFTLIDSYSITNLLSEDDQFEIEKIIKKHIPNVFVEFFKIGQLSNDPKIKDIWIIRVRSTA